MKKKLLDILLSFGPLGRAAKTFILEHGEREEYKKKISLLRMGETCDKIWFIETGLIRCVEKFKRKVVCNWFMREGDFATSVTSFFMKEPTTEIVETLENCVVYSIARDKLFAALRKHPDLLMVVFLIVVKYYCQTRKMESILRRKTPEQLYDYLLQYEPELVSRVPGKSLASFMGISEPTFYDIKYKRKGKRTKIF